MFQIAKADAGDMESIARLSMLFHIDIPNFKWTTSEWISEEIEHSHYYVLRDDSDIIGIMCLKTLEERGYIETIAVQKEKQKKGFGKQMIEFAMDISRQEGKSGLCVESFCEYGARGFYEKCGFVKDPDLKYYEGRPYYRFLMDF